MKRAATAKAAALLLAAAVITAGCSQQQTVVSSHDLDRPTDMVFGCVGLFPQADGPSLASGRPIGACKVTPALSTDRTFAFVTNSARGELSVIDMDRSKLVDLDLSIAGFNTVPLGQLPEALSISDDGCRIVSANRGSCDLTVVDPGTLMAPTIAATSADAGVPEPTGPSPTQTVVVRTGSGKRLAASPYEIQFLPQDTSALDAQNLCLPDRPRAPPVHWQGEQTGWKAVVTFPACDLVAVIDLPSGLILDSVKVKTDAGAAHVAIEHTGTEPVCPIECGVGARPVAAVDAGEETVADQPDDGGTDGEGSDADDGGTSDASGDSGVEAGGPEVPAVPPPGPFPDTLSRRGVGPLALHPLEGLAFVGLTNAPHVVRLSIAPDTGMLSAPEENNAGIPLQAAIGVRRIRLSVDPFADPEHPFLVPDTHQTRKYLYAIVGDGTVRVIDINRREECDNNIDVSVLTAEQRAMVAESDCVTVADAQKNGWHNALITGPGIHLPSNPRDVAFTRVDPAAPSEKIASQLTGVFAFILTDSGAVYLTNIDTQPRIAGGAMGGTTVTDTGDPVQIIEPQPLPNSLRNRNWVTYQTAEDTTQGPPRLDLPPSAQPYGPRIEHVFAWNTVDNGLALTGQSRIDTFVYFPNYFDKGAPVTPQAWTVTWEGALVGLKFSGLRTGPKMSMDTGQATDSLLSDPGGAFCDAGVTNGDIVTLLGCSDNNQCGAGQVCKHSPTVPQTANGYVISGLCLNPDAKTQDTQVKVTCRRLLESIRRYEVVAAHPDKLVLRPHIDEYVQVKSVAGNPFRCHNENETCGPPDSPDTSYGSFRCVNLGAPGKEKDLRCVNPCAAGNKSVEEGDVDCRVGRKCVNFGSRGGKLCADAPSELDEGGPDAGAHGCFPQLTAYSIQAGRSFLVQGSATGIPVATIPTDKPPPGTPPDLATADRGLFCPPPEQSPSPLVYRISMDAPACDVTQFQPSLNSPQALLALDTRYQPTDPKAPKETNLPLQLLEQPPTKNPNPCLFLAGPNDSDVGAVVVPGSGPDAGADGGADGATAGGASSMRAPGEHIRAMFRNPELQFLLTNIEQQAANNYQIRFDVHGGFLPQAVVAPGTIEIGLPARLVTSPLSSLYVGPMGINGPAARYMFVVDQRRVGRNRLAGGATRGQVLRINLQRYNATDSTGAFGPLLTYEDLSASGGYFPIQ